MKPRTRGPVASEHPEAPPSPSAALLSDLEYFEVYPLMVPVVGVAPSRIHRATDILATHGTPVVAATAGKLLRLSNNPLGGITIYMLDANARFLYYYAHLDRYADQLKAGATVEQGQLLGYVGKTGNASVPHLHFQAMRWDPKRRDYWNCDPVDIRPYFTLSGQERTTKP
jgi:murein DD-endopeptidase MepM/ murein hydrolase activator NlpD